MIWRRYRALEEYPEGADHREDSIPGRPGHGLRVALFIFLLGAVVYGIAAVILIQVNQ